MTQTASSLQNGPSASDTASVPLGFLTREMEIMTVPTPGSFSKTEPSARCLAHSSRPTKPTPGPCFLTPAPCSFWSPHTPEGGPERKLVSEAQPLPPCLSGAALAKPLELIAQLLPPCPLHTTEFSSPPSAPCSWAAPRLPRSPEGNIRTYPQPASASRSPRTAPLGCWLRWASPCSSDTHRTLRGAESQGCQQCPRGTEHKQGRRRGKALCPGRSASMKAGPALGRWQGGRAQRQPPAANAVSARVPLRLQRADRRELRRRG